MNRKTAGKRLAAQLRRYVQSDVAVLALPRGGVVVGAEVAKLLHAPLGIILVRKIGHPANTEYAIGAVAENEAPVYDQREVAAVDQTWLKLEEEAAEEMIEERHEQYYDHVFVQPNIEGRDVVIVDDGVATGLTMRAAIEWARSHGVRRIIAAAPVVAKDVITMLRELADEVEVLIEPADFLGAVGAHYKNFDQVDDMEVRQLLLLRASRA